MEELTSIWKDRGVNAGDEGETSESFAVPDCSIRSGDLDKRKHERRKIDAFELWRWRRVPKVSWMERKTNIWIIENIKPEWTLESRVPKAALSYFGHVVRAGGMEDEGVFERSHHQQHEMPEIERDEGWRGAVMAVTRGRMRLDVTR